MNRNFRGLSRLGWQCLGAACWLLVAAALSGCGSSDGVPHAAAAGKETKPKSDVKHKKTDGSKTTGSVSNQKSIDGIPYDVFFDKPLVIAANAQTGAASGANVAAKDTNSGATSTPSTENSAVGSATTKEPAKDAGSGGGGTSLKDIIDKDSLANEVKSVRNYLAGKAASIATYNSSYLEIPPEAATLSVLAVAVSRYPEDFSWKKNAKHVRDLAFKIAELTASKEGKTKNSFEAVKDAVDKIDDILKGSEPAGLADSEDDKDFGDAIGGNVVLLMKRLKKAEEILKTSVSSESGLKKDADRVMQEGAVLAFIGGIITDQGFGWGGDEEFAKYAKPLVDGGKQLVEAGKTGNYSLYGEAISRVSKSCNECHPKFKP